MTKTAQCVLGLTVGDSYGTAVIVFPWLVWPTAIQTVTKELHRNKLENINVAKFIHYEKNFNFSCTPGSTKVSSMWIQFRLIKV